MQTNAKQVARAQSSASGVLSSLVGDESGQAFVEVAFLLPVFVLLLIGVIDFGNFADQAILVGNASRAGVQYGALNDTTVNDAAGQQTTATSDMQNLANAAAAATAPFCACASAPATTVSCTSGTVCAAPDHRLTYARVTTTGTFSPLSIYNGYAALSSNITIDRKAVMQVSP